MKKYTLLLVTLFFGFFSLSIQADDYFVCDTGKDSNNGRSEATPFETYDKAMSQFNNLDAGDSILFCRGGKFNANKLIKLFNQKCKATSVCTIGDYGNANLDKPIINSNVRYLFNFENGGDAKPDGGYLIKNLTLISSVASDTAVRLFNDVDDLTMSNLHIEGFKIGVHLSGSNDAYEGSGSNKANDRTILKNSTIIKNIKLGFLGSCNNCLIENNHFENNGSKKSLDHNIYIAKTPDPAKGITIRNNFLYKSAMVDGKCQGVSLVGHGMLEDILIEGNTIKEDVGKVTDLCWGISIDPGYANKDESFKNITIRNNKLINVGMVGIGCASCDGALIENNEIIDEGNQLRAGIKVPVRGEKATKSKNVIIRNNNITLTHQNGYGVSIGGLHRFKVENNNVTLPSNTSAECFEKTGVNIDTSTINNLCKMHNGLSIIEDESPIPEEFEKIENVEVIAPKNESNQEGTRLDVSRPVYTSAEKTDVSDDANNIELPNSIPTDRLRTSDEEKLSANDSSIISVTNDSSVDNSIENLQANNPRLATSSGGATQASSTGEVVSFDENDNEQNNYEDVYPTNPSEVTSLLRTVPDNELVTASEMSAAPTMSVKNTLTTGVQVEEVNRAAKEDYSNIDPSTCRASANGRCLLR